MMKKMLKIWLLTFFLQSTYGQVGVGADNLESGLILKVESKSSPSDTYYGGLLLPRVALTATNVFLPVTGTPTTGLTVYNTAISGSNDKAVTPGFYFWDNSQLQWLRISQKNAGDTALFSNQDTTTDINDGDGIYADIFANVRFNTNPTLYQKINETTLKINDVGYYKVILNFDLASSGGADNFGIEIIVNETFDIVSDNMYIPGRWDDEGGKESNFPNGKSFVVFIPINTPGHTLKIRTYELDPGTDVKFKNANTSTLSIEKIR